MARLGLFSDKVRLLVDQKLVPLLVETGSVNALALRLNSSTFGQQKVIYPNRLHTLLSDDPNQSINEATLEAIEAAIDNTTPEPNRSAKWKEMESSALRLWRHREGHSQTIDSIAAGLGVPRAAARCLLESAGIRVSRHANSLAVHDPLLPHRPPVHDRQVSRSPDWSFQKIATDRCLAGLRDDPNHKLGLVIPTGGGKTRVALRIALEWLSHHPDSESQVVWVTHRKNLRDQAREELQAMLNENSSEMPEHSVSILADRIEFLMVSGLEARLTAALPRISLVIVDEAHHAAAPSYKHIFETPYPLNGLFLTATPNRTDDLPIGIDFIAYSITFRELEERGVILRPKFEDFPVDDFDWSSQTIRDLADEIVDRSIEDFTKVLVLAPRVAKVEEFCDELQRALAEQIEHPLSDDDVGYVHGGGNSMGCGNEEFLAVFRKKPRSIIVSAQLLLEGFNDPGINAVIVTYPSGSLIQVMQAAGRCVRYSPGKSAAYFIQARQDSLAYHFDHRWLYQEISDVLRPRLLELTYTSSEDLDRQMSDLLQRHRVESTVAAEVVAATRKIVPGDICRVLLAGLPFYGESAEFEEKSKWHTILETNDNSAEFRLIFNDFCARGSDFSDPTDLLRLYSKRFGFRERYEANSRWRSYATMLTSMYEANREIGSEKGCQDIGVNRKYQVHGPTTWLTYVTFTYEPEIPSAVTAFLEDCYNSAEVMATLDSSLDEFGKIIKVPLPIDGSEAHLLDVPAANEFDQVILTARQELAKKLPQEQFIELAAFLARSRFKQGLPSYVSSRIEYFLKPTAYDSRVLDLSGMLVE